MKLTITLLFTFNVLLSFSQILKTHNKKFGKEMLEVKEDELVVLHNVCVTDSFIVTIDVENSTISFDNGYLKGSYPIVIEDYRSNNLGFGYFLTFMFNEESLCIPIKLIDNEYKMGALSVTTDWSEWDDKPKPLKYTTITYLL